MKWIANLLADERGSISSKRIIALLSAFFLCATLLLNSFLVLNPSDSLVTAVMTICIAAMGSTSIDKFSTKNDDK